MGNTFRKLLACFLMLAVVASMIPTVHAQNTFNSYTYDEWDESQKAPAGYAPVMVKNGLEIGTGNWKTPSDFFMSDEGLLYVADTGNNRLIVLDENLELQTATLEECAFRYRGSAFSDTAKVILGARMKLQASDVETVKARMDELKAKRIKSQPLDYPSAGSTFKRPVGGYAAAMIDEAGLKGYTVGGAQVSEKHAGFVINRGGATCADVLALMEHIRKTVFDRTGITLEAEVKIIRSLR